MRGLNRRIWHGCLPEQCNLIDAATFDSDARSSNAALGDKLLWARPQPDPLWAEAGHRQDFRLAAAIGTWNIGLWRRRYLVRSNARLGLRLRLRLHRVDVVEKIVDESCEVQLGCLFGHWRILSDHIRALGLW